MSKVLSDSIMYIGVNDHDIELFEGQYIVPNGMAYNSYLIKDESVAIMDTVDAHKADEWMSKLKNALDGATPDYLVVSHMEPDHASCIPMLVEKYPEIKIVGNAGTFRMMSNFFEIDYSKNYFEVKEGDTLELGEHTLQFFMAPMVHWPEVMVTYEKTEKVLFSADAFGKFGALDREEAWTCEARRYYFNIVGKFGVQVQALLHKASQLDIEIICPLHGPQLNENLEFYINKYDTWSKYQAEDKGVLIAYASVYGNTEIAAQKLYEMLDSQGVKVAITNLVADDTAEALEDAFRYDRIVFAAPTYNMSVFPAMEDFLHHLKTKNFQNRTVALVENGSWAPAAAKCMKEILSSMKDITILDQVVTIKSAVKNSDLEALQALADTLSKM